MKLKYKFCLFYLFTLMAIPGLNAQIPLSCGNGKINFTADQDAFNFQQRNKGAKPFGVTYLIRIYFHIGTDDNGSASAITMAELATEYATLQKTYSADNICFLNAGVDYVKSTFLNRQFNADSEPAGNAFATYQIPNCINVFYTVKINGNNTACDPPCGYGGIALGGIPGTFCLVAMDNVGKGNSVSHEVGHCLGLYHTFEKVFGLEAINGSNSTIAGDKITDTPADPYAYQGNSCFLLDPGKCLFTGICPDPNGEINYSPPYTNLMAYWWKGTDDNGIGFTCYPNLTTTNGQFARVNSFLGSFLPLVACSSPANVIQTSINVTSGYYMNSAINNFTTSGSVSFSGSAKATIGGGRINLEPGFHANPSSGIVRIEIKPCN